jgi:hypothetical protein
MSIADLRGIRDRVERVLDQATKAAEPEAKSDLACFACILTSAMIEVACRHYLARYVEKRAGPSVQSYVTKQLYFFQNPKTEYIEELLQSFDPSLAEKFVSTIGEEGKDAVDSVVNNKNQLVHGKGAGLGLDTMKRYHKDVVAALNALRDLVTDPAS